MGNGQTKEEKIIEETATKETYLECPILVDLNHGTIRHRHEERAKDKTFSDDGDDDVKIGYFYHPRLNDFSEDAIMGCADNNRLKYVFKGPQKDVGKKLYYIYGSDKSDRDEGISHGTYKPQGKGFSWPQSYRKANNLYYDITFVVQKDEGKDTKSDEFLEDSISQSSGVVSMVLTGEQSLDTIRLDVKSTETVDSVIERISLHLLIPSVNIHLLWNKSELKKNDVIADFNDGGRKAGSISLLLRLT